MGKGKKIATGIIVAIVIFVGVGIGGMWIIGAAVVNSSNDIEAITAEEFIADIQESSEQKSIGDISINPKFTQEELDARWNTSTSKFLPTPEELGEGWSFPGTEYPQNNGDGTKATMWYYHTYYHDFVVTISKNPEFIGTNLSNPDLVQLFSQFNSNRENDILSSSDIRPECVVLKANKGNTQQFPVTVSACFKDDYKIRVGDNNPHRIDPYGENRYMADTDYKAVIWISNIILDKMK